MDELSVCALDKTLECFQTYSPKHVHICTGYEAPCTTAAKRAKCLSKRRLWGNTTAAAAASGQTPSTMQVQNHLPCLCPCDFGENCRYLIERKIRYLDAVVRNALALPASAAAAGSGGASQAFVVVVGALPGRRLQWRCSGWHAAHTSPAGGTSRRLLWRCFGWHHIRHLHCQPAAAARDGAPALGRCLLGARRWLAGRVLRGALLCCAAARGCRAAVGG
jgi:hypothetical protein